MSDALSRRELFARTAAALFAGAAGAAAATAAAETTADATGGATPHLEVTDPAAVTLGYVADAAQVDAHKYPAFRPGQNCSTCLQLQGKAGEPWRPCVLFPKKLVSAAGWCAGYAVMM